MSRDKLKDRSNTIISFFESCLTKLRPGASNFAANECQRTLRTA